jgi:hypothetical protein
VLQRHKGKYRIYNLCVEKAYQYDHAKFGNSVQCTRSALSAKQPFGLMPRYLRPPGISNRTYICFKAARWRLLWLTGSGLLCSFFFGAMARSRCNAIRCSSQVACFPFYDHNPPPFQMIAAFCRCVSQLARSLAGLGQSGRVLQALPTEPQGWSIQWRAAWGTRSPRTCERAVVGDRLRRLSMDRIAARPPVRPLRSQTHGE